MMHFPSRAPTTRAFKCWDNACSGLRERNNCWEMPASARPLQLELSSGAGNRIEEGESPVQSRRRYMPAVVLGCLLAGFLIIESFIPLGTAVQIGADEGFELAKATLCLKGH